MSKQKTKRPSNFGGLSIQKREDKNGHNYFVDKQGNRKSGAEYSLQWSTNGRVKNSVFEKSVKQYNKVREEKFAGTHSQALAKGIVDQINYIERTKSKRAAEIEKNVLAKKSGNIDYDQTLSFDITTEVRDAKDFKFQILKPNGQNFVTVDYDTAMEITQIFNYELNQILDEMVKKGQIKSPMVKINTVTDEDNKLMVIDLDRKAHV